MLRKPTVPEVLPLVRELYNSPGGRAGCCLHIVLDDGNIDDDDVDFCIRWAIDQQHERCERLARILRLCSKTQRRKLSVCG